MKGCLIKLWKIILYTLGGITALVLLAMILSLFAKPKADQPPATTPVAAEQAVVVAPTNTSTAMPPTNTPTVRPSPTSPPPTNTPQPTNTPLTTATPSPTNTPTEVPPPTNTPLPQNETLITEEAYGDKWPFTVKQGVLSCENISEVILTVDGVSFAINGTAKSTKKYQPVEKIWADNPAIPGAKKSVGNIIKSGLALCP